METKHKKYDKYKPSGVEWLGDVPEHWEVKRLKYLCSQSAIYGANEASSNYTDDGIRFLRTTDITDEGTLVENGAVFLNLSLVRDYILKDGDILLSRSGTLGRSLVYNKEKHGECAYAGYLVRFVPNLNLNSQFCFYFTKSDSFFKWLDTSVIQSTIGNVNGQKYANMPLPTPSTTEQQTIADFLDRRMGAIDDLIAKKERVIELLREKRTALINHAVTKGLNPDAKMKDSGVEWLGKIPEDWEVKRLRFIIKDGLVNGLFKKKEFLGSGVKLVNVFDIYRDNFLVDFDSLERVDANELEATKYAVESGNIFFVRSSLKLEGVGKSVCIAKVPEATVFECHVVRIKPDENRVQPEFLINYLNSTTVMDRLVSLANTVTMTTLDQMKMKDLEIAVPSVDEQKQIVEKLKREYYRIQTLIDKVTEAIEKLKEYRTALISAAVTGKIDVRQEVSV